MPCLAFRHLDIVPSPSSIHHVSVTPRHAPSPTAQECRPRPADLPPPQTTKFRIRCAVLPPSHHPLPGPFLLFAARFTNAPVPTLISMPDPPFGSSKKTTNQMSIPRTHFPASPLTYCRLVRCQGMRSSAGVLVFQIPSQRLKQANDRATLWIPSH